MPRKKNDDLEGGGFFTSLGKAAAVGVRTGAKGARGLASGVRGLSTAQRAAAVGRAANAARAATSGARAANAAARAARVARTAKPLSGLAQGAQGATTLGSRVTSGLNYAGLGLTLGMPIYSIMESEKAKKEQEARDRVQAAKDAMYEKKAEEQKVIDDATAAKYQSDYDADREKLAARDALEEERYQQAEAAALERQRLQDEIAEQQYADLMEQQQLQLILQSQMEEERTARLEAAIQSALSAGLRGKTPSVPANLPTPTNPRPPVGPSVPSKAPPRYGRGFNIFGTQTMPATRPATRATIEPSKTPRKINPFFPEPMVINKPKPIFAVPNPRSRETLITDMFKRGVPSSNLATLFPRRGMGKSKNVRTMRDLQMDLAMLGYSL